MSQQHPYNANMIPGGYNGAANPAAANHYGANNHHPQVAHNPVAEMHAAAAAGRNANSHRPLYMYLLAIC